MQPSQPITHTYSLHSVELFLFFIAFSVITSMWTNLGTVIMNTYVPQSGSGVKSMFIGCIVVTLLFALVLSQVGLSFTDFGVP